MEILHFHCVVLVITCLSLSIGIEGLVQFLPQEEVDALHEIADQLGKKDWNNPHMNPCDYYTPKTDDVLFYNNTVLCNCTIDDQCHVTHIIFKGQDLPGVLPPSLAKLPYIKVVDLYGNYLNGTIPKEWASNKLEILSVGINRLSGQIPDYLGNITSLLYLDLENNMFNGQVPASLGKLVNLDVLNLNTNNLTGAIPTDLFHLTKLKQLRLSSNNFVGKLPSFSNLTNLQILEIQRSGFEGPIPSDISLLSNLTELRISDLNGEGSDFPQLGQMPNMTRLMLRSCNISGTIPSEILQMSKLQIMDLSLNKLHGQPPDFGSLLNLEYLYLTGNFLSGPIPLWAQIPATNKIIADLSYNNFSESSLSSHCPDNVNLFRSVSGVNSLGPSKCLPKCTQNWYSFHINCAGTDVDTGSIRYEADEASEGFAKFVHEKENWGSSSTGHFWDVKPANSQVTARNTSVIQADNAELYETARLSPLTLTYYGNCLANGNYTVKLHFAEITFTNNQSYRSLGRRIFDIYIQNELRKKDFDIEDEDEAGRANKEVIKKFKTVVKNRTLEIQFRWAGLGTTIVPTRGNSGPLISAISVKSDFDPPFNKRKKIIIIAASVSSCLILILIYALWWNGYVRGQKSRLKEWKSLAPQIGFFTLKQIKTATKNFDAENKIGQGGFGSVFKGVLPDGTVIAVKQLSSGSKQGNREFVNEVGMISGLQHPNLVKLYGCCVESRQLILVYEYLENNCLAGALFGKSLLTLDWPTRQRICLGIAKGLAFLHEESVIKVVHRDIKATNVLLDGELNPKISDFGLAKLDEEENTHITTRVAGTIGYMAPEYALWGYLTYKADVYSFGIVALEIVAGMSNMNYQSEENYVCLLDKALVLQQKGDLLELVDSRLSCNYNSEEAIRMIRVALLCTNPSPALRPNMSAVVSMLEGEISVDELNVNPSIYSDELKFKGLREKYDEMNSKNRSETDSLLIHSVEAPNTNSSAASARDLYPIN